ncbi:response regulator [Azospirillum sp. TSA2s]|uniref:response regulator n=1 Tax=Azospirillum sp. TSA2s TaxID=709810 RepID=UPI00145B7CE0|nr:response regulator [Azospirillum sp. TSA2s]
MLVIDDVEEVRYSLAATLIRERIDVVEAGNGMDALLLLEHERFDAIITDVWMPKLDGVELIRLLRAADDDTVIVAISGGAPNAPINFSMALAETWGADATFVKPFDNEDMIAHIRRLWDEKAAG